MDRDVEKGFLKTTGIHIYRMLSKGGEIEVRRGICFFWGVVFIEDNGVADVIRAYDIL